MEKSQSQSITEKRVNINTILIMYNVTNYNILLHDMHFRKSNIFFQDWKAFVGDFDQRQFITLNMYVELV